MYNRNMRYMQLPIFGIRIIVRVSAKFQIVTVQRGIGVYAHARHEPSTGTAFVGGGPTTFSTSGPFDIRGGGKAVGGGGSVGGPDDDDVRCRVPLGRT